MVPIATAAWAVSSFVDRCFVGLTQPNPSPPAAHTPQSLAESHNRSPHTRHTHPITTAATRPDTRPPRHLSADTQTPETARRRAPQPPETGIPHGEPVGNWPHQPRKKPLPDSHPDHSTRHQPLPQAFPAPGTENRREVLTSRRFPVFALVRGLFVRERGVEALFYQPIMTP